MSESVRCDNREPHTFHRHTETVAVHCSGQARCGVREHAPHTVSEAQALWCPGICDCGLGRGLHGPGEHK